MQCQVRVRVLGSVEETQVDTSFDQSSQLQRDSDHGPKQFRGSSEKRVQLLCLPWDALPSLLCLSLLEFKKYEQRPLLQLLDRLTLLKHPLNPLQYFVD